MNSITQNHQDEELLSKKMQVFSVAIKSVASSVRQMRTRFAASLSLASSC